MLDNTPEFNDSFDPKNEDSIDHKMPENGTVDGLLSCCAANKRGQRYIPMIIIMHCIGMPLQEVYNFVVEEENKLVEKEKELHSFNARGTSSN